MRTALEATIYDANARRSGSANSITQSLYWATLFIVAAPTSFAVLIGLAIWRVTGGRGPPSSKAT
jgi:hypothetical protein